jgi:membrane protein DedA with SNARE-associated domain
MTKVSSRCNVAEIINQLAAIIQQLIVTVGYPGIFLMQFGENVFPPIPTDTLLPFSGVVAASGRLQVVVVWLVAVLGSVSGSVVLYGIGRWADELVIRALLRRYGRLAGITEERLAKGLQLFRRYGAPMIVFGRWLPAMRSAISLTAGMSRMSLPLFVMLTAFSSSLSMALWIGIGYVLGENWRVMLGLVDQYEPVILTVLIVVAVGTVTIMAWRFLHRRNLDRKLVQDEQSITLSE